MDEDKYAEIDYDAVMHDTGSAVLILIDRAEYWIPRSLVKNPDDLDVVNGGTMEVEEWFAIKEGLL